MGVLSKVTTTRDQVSARPLPDAGSERQDPVRRAATAHPTLGLQQSAGNRFVHNRLMRQSADKAEPEPGPATRAVLGSSGAGSPLPATLRARMEHALGADLGDVRVHTGQTASLAATELHAHAFTHGRNIFFAENQFQPGTSEGDRLVGHEVAHTVQQESTLATPAVQSSPEVSQPGDPLEVQAETVGNNLARGEPVHPGLLQGGAPTVIWRSVTDDVSIMTVTEEWARSRSVEELERDLERLRSHLADLSPESPEYVSAAQNLEIIQTELAQKTQSRSTDESPQGGSETGPQSSVGKPGRVARPEWNIRAVPDPSATPFKRLTINTAVFVDVMTQAPGEDLAWYHVVTGRGENGWMRSDGIALDPPEPSAAIHYVESGEKLINIAARYYGSQFRRGEDARFYVAALAHANQNRPGIMFPPGFTETDWEERTTWRDIGVRSNHAIWIPDVSFLRSLRSMVSSGSITGGMWAAAKEAAQWVWDWAKYGAGVVAGILRGAYESVRDLFVGAVHLVKAVWSVLESLVRGNIVSDARALWDAIMDMDLSGLWESFVENWNHDDPWERGMFRGRVLGYIAVEIALAVFSVGALTAVKWAGRFARVTSRLSRVSRVESVASNVGRSRRLSEVPDAARRELRRRFDADTSRTRAEPSSTRSRVDPEIDAMVERGIVESPAATGAGRGSRSHATEGARSTARSPELAAGFRLHHTQAFSRLLGKPLTNTDVSALGRVWSQVANPGEAARLTERNSRRLFNNHRRRFWRAVRNDSQARQLFEDAGCVFPRSRGSAPYYELPSGQRIRMTVDHIAERQSAFSRALDPSNLRIVFERENTVMLRLIQQLDPFQ